MTSRNDTLFDRAQQFIPAGVNSPVRAFRAVGGTPRFFARAEGPYFWDADGKRYIDYMGSWGTAVAGHAHPKVVEAVRKAAGRGLSYGAPTEAEIEMAELLCKLVPSMALVRLVSSGTEATMTALRLARGFTGRPKIIKFEGCYHGHGDSLLVKAGSGALTFGNPSSAGVPPEIAGHTVVLSFNDTAQLEDAFRKMANEIAGVIVEPVAGNMNLVEGSPEFLRRMRELCTQYGAVLIFDEVMTGFRVGLECAQGRYGITPDLTTLGKVIGGGMPLAAFGGRSDIMGHIAPLGAVYQAGTLSGNPVAVAAGLATMKIVQEAGFYEGLVQRAQALVAGLAAAAQKGGIVFSTKSVGGMFGIFFRAQPPTSFAEVMHSDKDAFNRFFHAALEHGVYYAPSAFEAGFVSAAHSATDIAETVRVAEAAFTS
jgi:glutamate-1-semialdehyde 2,1-aminomutase